MFFPKVFSQKSDALMSRRPRHDLLTPLALLAILLDIPDCADNA